MTLTFDVYGALALLSALAVLAVAALYASRFPWKTTAAGPWMVTAFGLLFMRHVVTVIDRLAPSVSDGAVNVLTVVWNVLVVALYVRLLVWMTFIQREDYSQGVRKDGRDSP